MIFPCFFDGPFGRHFPNLGAKGGPRGTILKPLGGTGGKVKTMVSDTRNHQIEGWRDPERHLVKHFACNVFQSASRNELFAIFCRFGAQRTAHWGTLGVDFSLICAYFFRGQFLDELGGTVGKGRRQGRGLYNCLICNI